MTEPMAVAGLRPACAAQLKMATTTPTTLKLMLKKEELKMMNVLQDKIPSTASFITEMDQPNSLREEK